MTKEQLIAYLEQRAREEATQDANEALQRVQAAGLEPTDTLVFAMREPMLAERATTLKQELPALMAQIIPEPEPALPTSHKSWLRRVFHL